MRTDVKLGLASGAVLLVVLIAFLTLNRGGGTDTVRLVMDEMDPVLEEPRQVIERDPAPRPAVVSAPARPAEAAASPAAPAEAADSAVAAPGREVNWARLLESGMPLMSAGPARPDPNISYMMVQPGTVIESLDQPQAPAVGPVAELPAPPERASVGPTRQPPPAATFQAVMPTPDRVAPAPAAPGGTRTHVVRSGETLSSIAAAIYGSANFYPHILRANPGIDPNTLRPGTVLQLPDPSVVRPQDAAAGGLGSRTIEVDPMREYRVQENDSLYRIAVRLYGRGDRAEAIYELNKEAIGPNPDRLRLNMVLKLPEPPTVQAAR
jgi:nucleoid-associated protein YgaU